MLELFLAIVSQEHEIDEPFIDSEHPDLLHIGL